MGAPSTHVRSATLVSLLALAACHRAAIREPPAAGTAALAAHAVQAACGHAHNDYEGARPLEQALARGFCSIEVDVNLVGGELLVGHEPAETRPGRTLRALYLEPLAARVRRDGSASARHETVTLLVDLKTDRAATLAALERELEPFAFMLTRPGGEPRPVAVLASGLDGALDLTAVTPGWAAWDLRLHELVLPVPAAHAPLVSDYWPAYFAWNGAGAMAPAERDRLVALVELAHAQGRKVRFFGAPDGPAAWRLLLAAGVDLINTDDVEGLAAFLEGGYARARGVAGGEGLAPAVQGRSRAPVARLSEA